MTFLPAHILQPAGHRLPLRWLRLPLLLATLGLSCVCVAVGAQALDKSSKLEKRIMQEADMTGSTITFDMNDIRSTTIVLTTVASLLALTSLVFSTSLAVDWISHLRRPQPQYTSKERASISSTDSRENGDRSSQRPAFSTRTLQCQTLALAFLTLWLFTVLIPSTLFARTRSAHVTIRSISPGISVSLDPLYWDYGFLRCLAAAPWFSFIFSLPASLITLVAWKFNHPSSSVHKV